jgi:hypothetical protein
MECAGDGVETCYNESCDRKNACVARILVTDGAEVTCDLKPHPPEKKHHLLIKGHYDERLVEITWPSKREGAL